MAFEGLNESGRIDLALEIGGQTFRVLTCDVAEALSECGQVSAEVETFEDTDFEPLLESDASVVITIDGMEVRRFTRKLGRASFVGLEENSLHYRLELFPAFWFLRLGMNTRKFRDLTTEEIVSTILDEGGVTHEWRNTRKCESRPYCTQYRETHLAFVSRLLEFEGIYYYFEDDGTMVLADDTRAEPRVAGLGIYQLHDTEGAMDHGRLGVTTFSRGVTLAPGRATVNDHNFKTPAVSLLSAAPGPRDADLDVYDYPTGFRDPGVGAMLAKLRMEALTATKKHAEGTSSVPWFMPARRFTFDHGEAIDFSGDWLLLRVSHRFTSANVGDGRGSYENRFFAIPAEVPFRPLLKTPRPIVQGNHTAMVRGPVGEEIHTDRYGRAKVQFHWDREAKGTDEDSRWIRMLQETSSSMVLARVGWEVNVGYIDGDPERPIALARDINGQMMPSYGQPGHKNMMTILTESYPGKKGFNELRMDDSAGGMRMDWHAQRDLVNVVENDKTERITANQTHLVKNGVDRAVEKTQNVHVAGNETKDVQKNYNETVKQNRAESIGGNEVVKVKPSSMLTVTGNDTENVGSLRFTLTGIGKVSVPSPKEIAQVVVPHTLGAAAQEIGGGLVGGAVGDLLGGASLGDVGAGVANKLGDAAISGAMSGDIGGALKDAVGLPSGTPDVAGALKESLSADNLKKLGTDMVMDAIFKGSISRDTRKVFTRMVGGAQIVAAGGSIMNGANYLFTEVIGGLKLTLSNATIMQSASKFLIHTVGGLIMRKSKEDMSVSAKRTVVTVGGMAKMHSDEKVELRGKVIEIEAAQSVTLKSGALMVQLEPATVTIKGPVLAKAGQSITISGNPDKLTA